MTESPTLDLLREALAEPDGNPVIVRVRGGCMTPLAVDGDRAEVVAGRPAVGDVVFASLGESYVCHRVLAEPTAAGEPYRLAGDRTWRIDEHSADSLLGIVRALHRERADGTRVLRLDRSPWRWIAPLQARLHLFAFDQRRRPWGRLAEWLRLAILAVRGLGWRFRSPRRA